MLEKLLVKYDLLHSSIICNGKVKFNINYILDGKVYVTLTAIIEGKEYKEAYDFVDDNDFKNYVLPKIFQRYLSKNIGIKVRTIMGNETHGTLIMERKDSKDSLIVRNCSKEIIDLAYALLDSLNEVSSLNGIQEARIIFNSNSNDRYDTYVRNNIIFDYANYKTTFFKLMGNDLIYNSDIKSSLEDQEVEKDAFQLLILNIARYAYTFDNINKNVWDGIKESYSDNPKVQEICEDFKNQYFVENSIHSAALMLAEYEKNNDMFLHTSEAAVEEALEACDNAVNFFNNSYLTYWTTKQKYYASILDGQRQAICLDFISAHDLEKTNNTTPIKNKINIDFNPIERNGELINKFKNIKKQKLTFTKEIVQEEKPQTVEEQVEEIFLDVDREKIKKDADEQAKSIMELELERDQLKRDAEEFAKIILKTQKDHRKILEAAEEQAKRIIHLEKENQELKRLAEENAIYLLEEDRKALKLAENKRMNNNNRIIADDQERINQLLDDLSLVKNMNALTNKPTLVQEMAILEEKLNTLLSSSVIQTQEEEKLDTIEKNNPMEIKPVESLLALLRNSYISSHYYEQDGRYSLIEFVPFDEDTYQATIYTIKDFEKEIMMDAYFEDYQLTDEVLQEICEIFSQDALLVASKVTNRGNNRQDYVVIDSKNNTIKFTDFNRDLIDKIKKII